MRLLPLISVIALLSVGATVSLAPSAVADEVKYKSRPKPPSEPQEPGYKRPPNQPQRPPDPPRPPAERPPDRYHPEKKPPEPRRPPDQPQRPPDPPTPPPYQPPHGPYEPPRKQPYPPCPPPSCDESDPYLEPAPWATPIVEPVIPLPGWGDLRGTLDRRVRQLQREGFVGDVVIGMDGKIEFDRSSGSYYDIGAVSQAFTAWATVRLFNAQKRPLSTSIDQLFPNAPEDKRLITIEQLLQHVSGLGNTYAGEGETDRDAAVAKLLAQPRLPSTDFIYSEDGYTLLAAAIEAISGMDYESLVAESGVIDRYTPHTHEMRGVDWGTRGSGGIESTSHDLFAWASRFLGSRERDEITRARAWTEDGVGIGYGWCWTGEEPQLLQTSGAMDNGENVIIVVYPSDAVLVVTSHRFNGDVPWSERVANELEPIIRKWRGGWQRVELNTAETGPH